MNSVEDSFTNALGPKEKCLCCKQKDAVITMCVLLVLSILYHFGVNVGMRWGKPCFHWWEHWATTVTVRAPTPSFATEPTAMPTALE
eukprot:SAG11_NODE_100_length_16863_cov_12.374911_17_plen_87_part_00